MVMTVPQPSKEDKQRTLNISDAYFTRYTPPWAHSGTLPASVWRAWVMNQPIAMICREAITSYILSLDFKITPKESDDYDELRGTIKHYTKLIENGGYANGIDYTGLTEWLLADLLDIPFGAGMEIGHKNDSPEGRVMWTKPIDGGTLYPTLNDDYPVVQWVNGVNEMVWLPEHAIARMYMSPVSVIQREGWGMAPPEKIQLALEMLLRGDRYYANLLLDVPPTGILDMGDTEWDDAKNWVDSFRTFMANTSDALRIAVLAEHTTPANFIRFGDIPNNLMYDKITMKVAAIVAAGYGLSLSDIGLGTTTASGETLAGTIRSDRKTHRNITRIKRKMKYFWQKVLPDYLQFDYIDLDDEVNISVARARLANSQAWGTYLKLGMFDRKEARLQTLQDGLITISVPEEPPAEPDIPAEPATGAPSANRQLGTKVPPSRGGMGEVKADVLKSLKFNEKKLEEAVDYVLESYTNNFKEYALVVSDDYTISALDSLLETIYHKDDYFGVNELALHIPKQVITVTKNKVAEARKDEVARILTEIKSELPEQWTRHTMAVLSQVLFSESVFDNLNELEYDNVVNIVKNTVLETQEQFLSDLVESKIN